MTNPFVAGDTVEDVKLDAFTHPKTGRQLLHQPTAAHPGGPLCQRRRHPQWLPPVAPRAPAVRGHPVISHAL